MSRIRGIAHEGARYLAASALALAMDLGAYSSLIRLAGLHYLLAAPIGFALGLAAIYYLSVHWVFRHRRLRDNAHAEFVLFTLLGVAGLAINEGVIYAGVEWLSLGFEPAKLLSAGIVFCFNFGSRKLLLFTRY